MLGSAPNYSQARIPQGHPRRCRPSDAASATKPQTLNPKPQTLHPKPQTPHLNPYTLNPKPGVYLKPHTLNTQHLNTKPLFARKQETVNTKALFAGKEDDTPGSSPPKEHAVILFHNRCRANLEHTSQSRPDSSLGLSHFQCGSL